MEHAIIIGSAPCANQLRFVKLSKFTKIAINKSWALRNDFNVHVGLKSMKQIHEPPKKYKLKRVKPKKYNIHINKAGGNFLCSSSVALIAGYWAINSMPFNTITYYGCDLVFDGTKNNGHTHFYGVSDEGPLFNKHPCMKRQDLKSVRLFVWGLLHRVLLLNGSAKKGSLLAYPKLLIEEDQGAMFNAILDNPITEKIIIKGQEAFYFEHHTRTPAFDGRWASFAKDECAISALNKMLEKWEPVKELCEELKAEYNTAETELEPKIKIG